MLTLNDVFALASTTSATPDTWNNKVARTTGECRAFTVSGAPSHDWANQLNPWTMVQYRPCCPAMNLLNAALEASLFQSRLLRDAAKMLRFFADWRSVAAVRFSGSWRANESREFTEVRIGAAPPRLPGY